MTGRPETPLIEPGLPEVSTAVGDHRLFRSVVGAFATGVTVVTAGGARPHGMTANAFAAVSLDPPLVLVCVNRKAIMHEVLAATEFFAVSVLAASQARIARHFADDRRPQGWAQFESVGWSPGAATGVPLIRGAIAWLECAVWRTYDGGDHSIFLGRLISLGRRAGGEALVFDDGRFRQPYKEA